MTLNEYYNLRPAAVYPKTELIDEILKACIEAFGEKCVSRATIQNWCSGDTTPSDSKFIPILSKVTGIAEKDLF